jgi:uncharacterized membrane protein
MSYGLPTSWAWNFNGGTDVQSTLQNPVVTFPNTGQFTINLTVSNINGTSTYIDSNYITVTSNYTINTMTNVQSNINAAFAVCGIALALIGLIGLLYAAYMLEKNRESAQLYTEMMIACIIVVIVGFVLLGIGIGTLGQMFGALAPS